MLFVLFYALHAYHVKNRKNEIDSHSRYTEGRKWTGRRLCHERNQKHRYLLSKNAKRQTEATEDGIYAECSVARRKKFAALNRLIATIKCEVFITTHDVCLCIKKINIAIERKVLRRKFGWN